jgi:hypothetical protein
MAEGAGKALDAAMAAGAKAGKPVVLATSPLIAKAIIGGGSWSGEPPLLVPEWHYETAPGAAMTGLWTATTDPLPAYAAAGAAAGAYVAAQAREGGDPSCGVIFAESPSRPRAALAAFAEAYAASAEARPILVRELADQPSGKPAEIQRAATDPVPIAPASSAESAVKELLGSDIRVLFIALGGASGAAIRAAERPGLAIGADLSASEGPSSLAFRIIPDDAGLARALRQQRLAMVRSPGRGGSIAVPALLLTGPAAANTLAGKRVFASFLAEAANRAESSPKPPQAPSVSR